MGNGEAPPGELCCQKLWTTPSVKIRERSCIYLFYIEHTQYIILYYKLERFFRYRLCPSPTQAYFKGNILQNSFRNFQTTIQKPPNLSDNISVHVGLCTQNQGESRILCKIFHKGNNLWFNIHYKYVTATQASSIANGALVFHSKCMMWKHCEYSSLQK